MKNWFKLRYHLAKGYTGINNVQIDVDAVGDNLEDAIQVGRQGLENLLKLQEDSSFLTLVGIRQ
jgi:hypothetical protein